MQRRGLSAVVRGGLYLSIRSPRPVEQWERRPFSLPGRNGIQPFCVEGVEGGKKARVDELRPTTPLCRINPGKSVPSSTAPPIASKIQSGFLLSVGLSRAVSALTGRAAALSSARLVPSSSTLEEGRVRRKPVY